MTGDSSSILGSEQTAELSVLSLDQQIAAHRKAEGDRSVLSSIVGQLYRSDENSLARLEKLQQEVRDARAQGDTAKVRQMADQIDKAVKADSENLGFQDEFSHYLGGGLKTAALFFGGSKAGFLSNRGAVGLAATVGLYGLDQAKVSDSAGQFATNFAFGGAKGGLTKAMFHGLGQAPIESPALKGVVLGLGARTIDTGLTPENYVDATGKTNLAQGLSKLGETVTDTRMWVIDGALFAAAHGITRGANRLTDGFVDRRPFANTILTSGSFGLSGGAYHEYERQVKEGGPIDYSRIASRALLQGGIDMFAGVPGGLNADPVFRQTVKEKLSDFRDSRFRNAADRILAGGQPLARMQSATTLNADMEAPVRREVRTVGSRNPGDTAPPADLTRAAETGETGKKAGVDPSTEVKADAVAAPERPGGLDPLALEALRAAAEGESYVRKEYPPEDVARAKTGVEDIVSKLTGREPTPEQTREIIDFLKSRPEADNHVVELYIRNFRNPAVRRAIEAFYKPSYAMDNELALASPTARDRYKLWSDAFADPANRSILTQKWAERIQKLITRAGQHGPEVRELMEHTARTTRDQRAAAIIDAALGTKYSEALSTDQVSRTLPVTPEQLTYLRDLAAGKNPKPPAETTVAPEKAASTGTPEAKDAAGAERSAVPADPRFEAMARSGHTEQLLAEVEKMRTGSPAERAAAAERLARSLSDPTSADWFAEWIKVAPETDLTNVSKLRNEPVQRLLELAPDAVHKYLCTELPQVTVEQRIATLDTIARTLQHNPQVASELLRAVGGDPRAMQRVASNLADRFGGKPYTNMLETVFAEAAAGNRAMPDAAEIAGPTAMLRARLRTSLGSGSSAETAYLLKFAEASPANMQVVEELVRKLPDPEAPPDPKGRPPKGQDLQDLLLDKVRRLIAAGAEPGAMRDPMGPADQLVASELLDAGLLGFETRLRRSYERNPEALKALIDFGRANRAQVEQLLKMPGMVEQPRSKPGQRPDPKMRAQQNLARAYEDFMGIIAAESVQLGPVAGMEMLQKVRSQFADSIAKWKAANASPENAELVKAATESETALNKLTNPLLPADLAARTDAMQRRSAIAQQNANEIPRSAPPEQRPPQPAERPAVPPERQNPPPTERTDTTPPPTERADTTPPPTERADTTPPPTERADTTPPPTERTDTTPPPTERADTTPPPTERADTTPPPTERADTTPPPTERTDTPAPERAQSQPQAGEKFGDGVELRVGPSETVEALKEMSETRKPPQGQPLGGGKRGNSGPIIDDNMLSMIQAEEAAREQSWRARRDKDRYEEDVESDGQGEKRRGKGRGRGGYRSAGEWRRANRGEEDYDN